MLVGGFGSSTMVVLDIVVISEYIPTKYLSIIKEIKGDFWAEKHSRHQLDQ